MLCAGREWAHLLYPIALLLPPGRAPILRRGRRSDRASHDHEACGRAAWGAVRGDNEAYFSPLLRKPWRGTTRRPASALSAIPPFHSSARGLFAYAARNGCGVRSVDLVAAYLQGAFLDGEVIYTWQPTGHVELGHAADLQLTVTLTRLGTVLTDGEKARDGCGR